MQGCRAMANITMDALHYPRVRHSVEEVVLGEIVRQSVQKHMRRHVRRWLTVSSWQILAASYRQRYSWPCDPAPGHRLLRCLYRGCDQRGRRSRRRLPGVRRQVDAYYSIRRDTLGFRPLYALTILELPDEVVHHLAMVELELRMVDMLMIDNVGALVVPVVVGKKLLRLNTRRI